jgi:hypothetical protein
LRAVHRSPSSGPPPIAAPPSADALRAHDFFSLEWAKHQVEGGGKDQPRAEQLRKQGLQLYKQKKDDLAVAKYEAALDLMPSGQLYYAYANSLSNIGRLADSVKAYELAVELAYDHPEVAVYNMACAQARLQDADAATASLTRAVGLGYRAIARMANDPELAFLRQQPDWRQRYLSIVAQPQLVAGKLEWEGDRSYRDIYTVCPNGRVETKGHRESPLDESCCGGRLIGHVFAEQGKLMLHWDIGCGRRGRPSKYDDPRTDCHETPGCFEAIECEAMTIPDREFLSLDEMEPFLTDTDPDELYVWHRQNFAFVPPVCNDPLPQLTKPSAQGQK